jgi:hypothetical protein
MTAAELIAILKDKDFKFKVAKCRDENISLQSAKFLRWVMLNAPCTNAQVMNTFGMGLAYTVLKPGYVTNPLGQSENTETNLWSLTPAGVELLKRLIG